MSWDGSRVPRLPGGPSEPQLQHKIDILKKWDIISGSKILEIGCGQGDCTLVLADLVGEHGHVAAIDPAPLDYGAPMTLGEAQQQLKSSPVGNRITFHQAYLQDFLNSEASEPLYDYAVFVHSIWYLPSVETLQSMLLSLRGRVKQLLLAEYTLDIRGDIAALPHLIASISQAEFNSRDEQDASGLEDNIQSIISPKMIRAAALHAGWELKGEETTEASEGLEDGGWEVGRVLSKRYLERTESGASSKRRQEFANALIEAVEVNRNVLGPQLKVKTLPTWQGSWV